MPALDSAILLPCGSTIRNRLAKAAMTEGMATAAGLPTPELIRLYSIWAKGGAGLLLSGNIQIDRDHLERLGNVIIDAPPSAAMQKAPAQWAQAATQNNTQFWGANQSCRSADDEERKSASACAIGHTLKYARRSIWPTSSHAG